MNKFNYPDSPKNTDKKVLKPTRQFKIEALKVGSSILLFVSVYVILILLSIGLAGIVSFLGIKLILIKLMFITVMIGLGLIGLGLMVIYFLVKFIFTIKKVDRTGFIEIKKTDFPELFAFVKKTAGETKTPMPKRIYLSSEVNACVFYDSSFLSMFFPVRKNLLIGLGLVNSVNLSEFKAVLAHEFGHFSQHSMALGSYVYNVNKIIYNMLFENEGYSNTIETWASTNGYFAIFAAITIKIVQSIQWVLQKVYIIVNKTNLSLSRQMEHHADAVSAFVSGPNNIINSLDRIDISQNCFNVLINKYNTWIADNIKPINLFEQHREIISHFADEHGYGLQNGLPDIKSIKTSNIRQSRIVIKDQWASHPGNRERESFLKTLNIEDTVPNTDSPWVLFENNVQIQNQLTELLFSTIKFNGDIVLLDIHQFKEKYYNEFSNYSFDKDYKGYFNNRKISHFDPNEAKGDSSIKYENIQQLFSEENCSLPGKLDILNSEIQMLNSIHTNQIRVKTFDFDGKKHDIIDIPNLISKLESEKTELQRLIQELDVATFKYFYHKVGSTNQNRLIELYNNYFKQSIDLTKAQDNYQELINTLSPIYQKKLSVAEAHGIIDNVKTIEKGIKQHITEILPEAKENKLLDESQFQKIDLYLLKYRDYFDGAKFNNIELDVLAEAMNLFLIIMYNKEFKVKKVLLEKQLEISN